MRRFTNYMPIIWKLHGWGCISTNTYSYSSSEKAYSTQDYALHAACTGTHGINAYLWPQINTHNVKKSLRMLGMDSSLENCRIAFLPSLTLPLQPKSLLTSEPGIGKVKHFCNYIDIWQMSGVYSYTSINARVVPLWLFIMLVCQAGFDQPSLSIQGSERSSRCYYS